MRSLRIRVFLLSWPIVVAAVLVVGLGVERWASGQIVLEERRESGGPPSQAVQAWQDSIGAVFDQLHTDGGRALVQRLARVSESAVVLVVLDTAGQVVATSDTTIAAESGATEAAGAVSFRRRVAEPDGRLREQQVVLTGFPLVDAAGQSLGALYILPVDEGPPPPPGVAWRGDLRRTLWWTALVASLAAAAAALMLAGPLVHRLKRLTRAAEAVRAGALDTRVPVQGPGELSDLEQAFNDMARSLSLAVQHQRNLASDVAHELRTPLTNILGAIEALQDGLREPDAATLASLREEAGLLATLVNDLQELSLAESGQLAFAMQPLDAVAAASAAVEAVRDTAGGIRLHAPSAGSPLVVDADPTRLGQVLRNLLRNAITHTPPGGTIRVEVERLPDAIAITVADTGCGIPADQLDLIWDRFHRVDPSRDRASGGMGLGLALVRQLVQGMGGSVSVASTEGSGSAFRILLRSARA